MATPRIVRLRCANCGREFDRTIFAPIKSKRQFCSDMCKAAAYALPEVPCPVCGKSVSRKTKCGKSKKRMYCSRDCAAAAQKRGGVSTCNACGALFYVPRWAKQSGRKHCSLTCRNVSYTLDPDEKRRRRNQRWHHWAQRHPDKIKVFRRKSTGKWAKKLKESNPNAWKSYKVAAHNRRRARRYRVSHNPYTIDDIIALRGRICGICGQPLAEDEPFHIDHIIPISKGGPDVLQNVQLAHPSCNARKRDRTA